MVIFQSQVINFDGEQEYDTDSINMRLPQQPQRYTSKSEQLTFISCRLKGEVASTHPLQPISLSHLWTPKMLVMFPAGFQLSLRSSSQMEKKPQKPVLQWSKGERKRWAIQKYQMQIFVCPIPPTLVITEKLRKFEMHFAHRLSINNATLHFISLIFPMGSLSSLI